MYRILSLIILLTLSNFIASAQQELSKAYEYYQEKKLDKAKREIDKAIAQPANAQLSIAWYYRALIYWELTITKEEKYKGLANNAINEVVISVDNINRYDRSVQKGYADEVKTMLDKINQYKSAQSAPDSRTESSIPDSDGAKKPVTLTEIGQGKTKDAAKYNALRNAIEKAFGTFISSNTTLLNDELVKDEIVSVSSGNIQNYEIISETQMPDGSFSSVVKATVSIGKLTKFCESKGISVEFKGGLFAANIKLQELNKKNEEAVMANLFTILNKIVAKSFDFKIDVSEPKKDTYNDNNWIVDFSVKASANKNLEKFKEIILSTIDNICLGHQETSDYMKQNIKTYNIVVNGKTYHFRNSFSIVYLVSLISRTIPISTLNFEVTDGISNYNFTNKKSVNSSYGAISEKYAFIGLRDENYKSIYNLSEFLKIINMTNINSTEIKYYSYDSSFEIPAINLDNLSGSIFSYNYSKYYTIDELNKLTEFKVQPIMK